MGRGLPRRSPGGRGDPALPLARASGRARGADSIRRWRSLAFRAHPAFARGAASARVPPLPRPAGARPPAPPPGKAFFVCARNRAPALDTSFAAVYFAYEIMASEGHVPTVPKAKEQLDRIVETIIYLTTE